MNSTTMQRTTSHRPLVLSSGLARGWAGPVGGTVLLTVLLLGATLWPFRHEEF